VEAERVRKEGEAAKKAAEKARVANEVGLYKLNPE
jgi:hypothetical protein